MFRKKIGRWSLLLLLTACLCFLASCGGDTSDQGEKAAEKLFSVMMECPNEKLAPMKMDYLALGETIAPDQESIAAEKEEEKTRWKDEIGNLFHEDDFEHFMDYSEWRLYFHSCVVNSTATISVAEIIPEKRENELQNFDVKLKVTDANGEVKECTTKWRVEYSTKNPELLYDVKLLDDGNILQLVV